MSGRGKEGHRAGYREGRAGYRLIGIDGVHYFEHQVIWFMLHGEWCPGQVDHIDRIPDNNKPSNLRKASESQQRQNKAMQRNNTSGHRGVTAVPDGWQAQYQHLGKNHYLGTYANKDEAAEVARLARLRAFGQFAPNYDTGAP